VPQRADTDRRRRRAFEVGSSPEGRGVAALVLTWRGDLVGTEAAEHVQAAEHARVSRTRPLELADMGLRPLPCFAYGRRPDPLKSTNPSALGHLIKVGGRPRPGDYPQGMRFGSSDSTNSNDGV